MSFSDGKFLSYRYLQPIVELELENVRKQLGARLLKKINKIRSYSTRFIVMGLNTYEFVDMNWRLDDHDPCIGNSEQNSISSWKVLDRNKQNLGNLISMNLKLQ